MVRTDHPGLTLDRSQCVPSCNEFYMVRMPEWFCTADMVIGFIYLVEYSLKLYIAPSRFNYFINGGNLFNLVLVIMPPIVFSYSSGTLGLFCLTVSRLLRM